MNKIKMLLAVSLLLFGINSPLFAMMCDMGSGGGHGEARAETTEKGSAENVGNKMCPVTGDPVDGKTSYEYEGKTYNFCCPGCIDEFKKNPEKYSAKEEQPAGSEHSMGESHQHGQ